jgi:2-methylcitrate dehydratase PrpD
VLHPGLDAVLELRARENIAPDAIARIRVILDRRAALPLVYDDPRDALQAKFSLPFAFSAALVDGAAGLEQFSARRLRDPKIRELMGRVEMVRRMDSAAEPDAGIDTEVEIHLQAGAIHRLRGSIARGHPIRPASRADIDEKFRQCGAGVLRPRNIESFLRAFPRLERARPIADWIDPLRSSGR